MHYKYEEKEAQTSGRVRAKNAPPERDGAFYLFKTC